jgi:hypothetical protein
VTPRPCDPVRPPRAVAVAVAVAMGLTVAACSSGAGMASNRARSSFLHGLHRVTQVASTVTANGDLNPYGVAVVPASVGRLVAGDTLVDNFNDRHNVMGTGTTVVEVAPTGSTEVFANISTLPAGQSCPGGIGLTIALTVLQGGWVVVGSLPTTTGGNLSGLPRVGCLIVLNDVGTAVETITNENLDGPWGLTSTSNATSAQLFVADALGGTLGTAHGVPDEGNASVLRIDLRLSATSPPVVTKTTVVGKAFPWRADQNALVLAPTGLALSPGGTLYVADTLTDTISAISHARSRGNAVDANATIVSSGGSLDAPLGMSVLPDGDLAVVNGNNGDITEITPAGAQIATQTLVNNGAGDLIGLATTASGDGILFVNDGTNALDRDNP